MRILPESLPLSSLVSIHHSLKFKPVIYIGIFLAGLAAGGYLFDASQPRSFLTVLDCRNTCYRQNDLAGLLASVGIQRGSGLLPLVAKETDRCIAINHPTPQERVHYVIFPKKDIKNIADVAVGDEAYIMDCLAVIRSLVLAEQLHDYRVYTNGPDLQDVTYLHFHLVGGVKRNKVQ